MKKNNMITIGIVVFIIAVSFFILTRDKPLVSEELAKCIGDNSLLYVQKGCIHCETQKKMFGDSYQFLNVVDCFYENDVCTDENIRATPTWVITSSGSHVEGIQSIDKLKSLTGC